MPKLQMVDTGLACYLLGIKKPQQLLGSNFYGGLLESFVVLILFPMLRSDEPVLVVGDLNDGQLSNTLNILTGQPRFLVGDSKGGSDTDLYSVSTMQGYRSLKNVYYTHIYQDLKESLDHILVSQEFYDNSRERLWLLKEMKIFNDHLHDKNHKLLGTGDHGIVRAEFEYRKARR